MTTVKQIALELRVALKPDALHIAQFKGGNTGQSGFHLVDVVPRWKGKELGILGYHEDGRQANAADLAALAAEVSPFVAATSLGN